MSDVVNHHHLLEPLTMPLSPVMEVLPLILLLTVPRGGLRLFFLMEEVREDVLEAAVLISLLSVSVSPVAAILLTSWAW